MKALVSLIAASVLVATGSTAALASVHPKPNAQHIRHEQRVTRAQDHIHAKFDSHYGSRRENLGSEGYTYLCFEAKRHNGSYVVYCQNGTVTNETHSTLKRKV